MNKDGVKNKDALSMVKRFAHDVECYETDYAALAICFTTIDGDRGVIWASIDDDAGRAVRLLDDCKKSIIDDEESEKMRLEDKARGND